MIRSRCISGYKVQGARVFFCQNLKTCGFELGDLDSDRVEFGSCTSDFVEFLFFIFYFLYKFELRDLR